MIKRWWYWLHVRSSNARSCVCDYWAYSRIAVHQYRISCHFSKQFWVCWVHICQKNIGSCLTLCAKINSKLILDINGKVKNKDAFDRKHTRIYSWSWDRQGNLRSSDGKESACNAGDPGSNPGLGRFPWRRQWLPIQVFLLGEFHGEKSLADYSPWVSKRAEWLTFLLKTEGEA